MFAGNLRRAARVSGNKRFLFVSEQLDNEGMHFSAFSRVLCLCVSRSLYLADLFIFQTAERRLQSSRNSFFSPLL